jgi:hypothetical protein
MSDLRRVDRSELVKPYEVDAPPRSLADLPRDFLNG